MCSIFLFLGWNNIQSGDALAQEEQQSSSKSFDENKAKKIEPKQSFTCDGRQYCSQMHSRAEAEYFIKNCQNTKMDGDNDGIPCENDSRF